MNDAPILVDSHCHLDMLNLKPYEGRLEAALDHARDAGVGHILCVSVNLKDYPRMRALVAPFPQVSISVGVHPNEHHGPDPEPEDLVEIAQRDGVVAIGETGLDYYRSTGDLEWQRARFRRHIAAARRLGKPLIVHSRAARADTIQILREEQARDVRGVMHCFAEDWDTAAAALDLGFYISFSGIVTYKNADDLREVAREVPADRILVETDAPYLAPVPKRGKANEPAFVRHTAAFIAELRGEDYAAFAARTTRNYQDLFGPLP